jgi:5,5'-dehydrodivanillate O-demethylase
VHVSFVHAHGRAGTFIEAVSQAIPELEYLETEAGLRQISNRGEGNVRISDWTFPNYNHISAPGPFPGDPWIDVGHWNVPVDDEHTLRLNIWAIRRQGGERDERTEAYFRTAAAYDPAQHHDALFRGEYPDDQCIALANAQDYVAQHGQGVSVDRSLEVLGRSDAGVALLRRVFTRELALLTEGKPTKSWRKLERAIPLPPQRPVTASA